MDIKLHGGKIMSNVAVAETWWLRLMGLFHPATKNSSGLLIYPCNSIHTFFMKHSIDVVFVNSSKKILCIFNRVRPNRIRFCFGAHYALELSCGLAEVNGFKQGDQIVFI